MKKSIYGILICFLSSCSVISLNTNCKESKDIYEIVNLHFENARSDVKMYYKTYGQDWSHYLKWGVVINRINQRKYKSIVKIKDSLLANPELTKSQKDSIEEAAKRKILITMDSFLSEEDIKYLSTQIQHSNSIKWNKKCFKNVTFSKKKQITKLPATTLRKYKNTSLFKKQITKLSAPIFTKDKNIALLLVTSTGSETLFFYRKNNDNNWEFYCSATLLIS